MTGVTIRMKHIRTAKLCAGGARTWFASHGFSWTDFLENGISEEELLRTEDPLAIRVVEIARAEHG